MEKEKSQIRLVVIGSEGVGKSVVSGHLIYKCGGINNEEREKIDSDSKAAGKDKYTWVLETRREIENGIYIDLSLLKFETPHNTITLTDTPGKRDFIKNMITGTSEADAALMIVAASIGEFEIGLSKYGQTQNHAMLAYTLGIKQLIIAINKMDEKSVMWDKNRYTEIVLEMRAIAERIGFQNVIFLPISALEGDNMVEKSSNLLWYEGPTLLEALDTFVNPKRHFDEPLRIPVQDVYNIGGIGTIVIGRVEAGIIIPSLHVTLSPGNLSAEVISIEKNRVEVSEGQPGDCIGFNVKNITAKEIKRGMVVGETENNPPKEAEYFIAQIYVLFHTDEIRPGFSPVLDCHAAHVTCTFSEFISKVDRRTGKVIEECPQFLKAGDAAIVKIIPSKPLCVEAYSDFPALGRFATRDKNQSKIIGVIKSVTFKENG